MSTSLRFRDSLLGTVLASVLGWLEIGFLALAGGVLFVLLADLGSASVDAMRAAVVVAVLVLAVVLELCRRRLRA